MTTATVTTQTAGQALATTLRRMFRVGTRTGRYGKVFGHRADLHAEMVEQIENAVTLPGYHSAEKTEILCAAWGAVLSYRKHYDGHRMDSVLRWRISEMSAYQFAALLGRMVDAGVTTTGDGEAFFAAMARDIRSA
jgi:truncated hemoglobin YjbI